MYTTFWNSQKQFIYSSDVGDGKGHHDERRKHSQTGGHTSHVEVMRYEETINHYTTTSSNAAPLPPPIPAAFDTFHGTNVDAHPVSSHNLIPRNDKLPEEEEEDAEMEEVVRAPSPSASLSLLDSKTRWLFVHCTFHLPHNHDRILSRIDLA